MDSSPYALLGITPEADQAAIKAAYHRQLRQFPAHSHPQEFQRLRAAYETVRAAGDRRDDPLQPPPLQVSLDGEQLAAMQARLNHACRLDLQQLLRLTF